MQREGGQVQAAIAALGRRGAKKRFPDGIREMAVAYVHRGRQAGWSWRRLSEACGLSSESLRRWTAEAAVQPSALALVPVSVVPEPAVAQDVDRGLVLVSPRGYRLEGLSLPGAAQLLSALR